MEDLSSRIFEDSLSGFQMGAAKSAIIKRYKFNLFKEFMFIQDLYGNYDQPEMTVTVANHIAKKIIGRSFDINQMTKVFAVKNKTAAKKSKYFSNGVIDNLVQLLDKEWTNQGYKKRMWDKIRH
jgi:hypothetical protein